MAREIKVDKAFKRMLSAREIENAFWAALAEETGQDDLVYQDDEDFVYTFDDE